MHMHVVICILGFIHMLYYYIQMLLQLFGLKKQIQAMLVCGAMWKKWEVSGNSKLAVAIASDVYI